MKPRKGAKALAKAKKEAKEREEQEAEAEAEAQRGRIEQEETEREETAATRLAAKPSDPLADKCAKCKKVWGKDVVHAECQFDGCGGHSLCEKCKGKATSIRDFTGGWTVETPWMWFCSLECRKGWYDELNEDDKVGRDAKYGKLPEKKHRTAKR